MTTRKYVYIPKILDNVLLFTSKSKQIMKFSEKRGFNSCYGVIRYADFKNNIVNNIWLIFVVVYNQK